MIQRLWHSREGGLIKATVAIIGGVFLAISALTGIAVVLDVIAGAIR
jgi:hypothetical protein